MVAKSPGEDAGVGCEEKRLASPNIHREISAPLAGSWPDSQSLLCNTVDDKLYQLLLTLPWVKAPSVPTYLRSSSVGRCTVSR